MLCASKRAFPNTRTSHSRPSTARGDAKNLQESRESFIRAGSPQWRRTRAGTELVTFLWRPLLQGRLLRLAEDLFTFMRAVLVVAPHLFRRVGAFELRRRVALT